MPRLALLTAAQKLRMAGICGSDLHIFGGELALPRPFATGHEIGLSFLQHTSYPFNRVMPKPPPLADVSAAFASAGAGLVPSGALVPR